MRFGSAKRACRRFATAAAGVFLAAQAFAGETVGEVTSARGSAYLDRKDSRERAAPGVSVQLNDTAVTGEESRLDMRLGRATRLRLGARASLRIDRFVAGVEAVPALESGPVVIERGKGAEPVFELNTPYALLAARGTVFFAGPSNGVFGVFVKSGIVHVWTAQKSVRLYAGEGTDIRAPGDPPDPPKVWGKSRVEEAFASVR